jgi:hypothetical protein
VPVPGHALWRKKFAYREIAVLWSEFESDVVEGRYPLGKLVRSEGRCGWFETRFQEQPALISLTESLNDEAMLLERLRAAERVKDKNVAAIFETGTTLLHDTPLAYAVMELTEENLEDVLRTRALTAEETKEVAEGLVNALQAIHKERLVCGRLEPTCVLAAGDTIKLRSDHLQVMPQEADFLTYEAKDVQGLGTVLWQCLTQRSPKLTVDGNDPSLQLLPQPFVQIVRKALSGKATVQEIAALLRPPARPAGLPSTAQPAVAKNPVAGAAAAAAIPASMPKAPQLPDEDGGSRTGESNTPRGIPRNAAWVLAGFVALLFVVGFAIHAMLHSSTHPPAVSDAATPAVVVAPPATATPAQPAADSPQPSRRPKVSAAPVAVATPSASVTGSWRVVAFTYNYQDQAEHKARTINEKHPDLQAGVFSPKGSGAPYLVILGTAMDRSSAFRLRGQAIQEGMPSDTFARNYSR